MTSEIRANTLKNRVGLGTVSFTNTGPVVSGIVTANTFRLPDATSGSLGRLQLGNGLHFSMYHDGSNSFLVNNNGYLSIQSQDGVNGIFIARNAEVNLYYGASGVRLQTSSSGVTINRDLDVDGHTNLDNVSITGVTTTTEVINIDADNKKLQIGASQDLQLFHDGGHSRITNTTGILKLTAPSGSSVRMVKPDDSGNVAVFHIDAETHLYYNGAHKFSTISDGIQVVGNATINDSIIHHGDTNTKIRFPSADTVSVETGGSERLRIDSSGRVLIGTTTEGHENADDLTIATSGTGGITIRTGTSNSGSIYFSDATSGTAEYAGFVGYSHANNSMIFGTNGAEKLRIMSNGYFGFGINSPSRRIHVHTAGSGSDYMQFTNDTTGTTAGDGYVFGINGSEDVIHNNLEATNTIFFTNGAERLRIDAVGNMSLGKGANASTNYTTQLQIHSTDTAGAALHLTNSSSGSGNSDGFHLVQQGHIYHWLRENAHQIFATNGVERARILSGGNVLIGTTTDSNQKLTLYGSNAAVIYQGANTGTGVANGFITGNNGNVNGFVWNYENGFIHFGTNSTERLRIAANGGVGIATDKIPRNYFLHIAAPSQDYTNTSTQLPDGGGIMFQHTDSLASTGRTYPGIFWSGNTSALGRARAGILGVTAANNDATHIAFLTRHAANGTSFYPSDERMRITHDGKVGINQSSPGGSGLDITTSRTTHFSETTDQRSLANLVLRQTSDAPNRFVGLSFVNGGGTQAEASINLMQTGNYEGDFRFKFRSGGGSTDWRTRFRMTSGGMMGFNGNPNRYLHVYGINGGGNFGTAAFEQNHPNNSAAVMFMSTLRNGSSSESFLQCNRDQDNNGQGVRAVFYIRTNGDVDSDTNSYGGISDVKLKENIVDAKSQWDDIKNIKVRNFNFKDNPSQKMLGVVAQEVETVSAGLVKDCPDENITSPGPEGTSTKSVKYSILYMKAIKALQEAQARIETLEAKVSALEG